MMADVDHAYQYSVEVKSRFSLFLDDNLNNEDPELLISKLHHTKRTEKKKEKCSQPPIKNDPHPIVNDIDTKQDVTPPKEKPVRATKSPKQPDSTRSLVDVPTETPVVNAASPPQNVRGRGAPRGFNRGFRGRGQGFRPSHDVPESAGDATRDVNYVPRGRGRGRGRGGFERGHLYTDHRETEGQNRTYSEEPTCAPPVHESATHEETVDATVTQNQTSGEEPSIEGEAEEPKVLTLEEYKALRSSQKPAVALSSKGTRKPNDGKDVFANMVAHRKINEVSDDEIVETEREHEDPQPININWTYTDRQEQGRGRGFSGSGFPRGRNPRGPMPRGRGMRGVRGFERQAAPPVIYSDQDFPSLK